MTEIGVRPAHKRDAAAIAQVHVRSWQEAYRGQIPDSYLDGLSVRRRTQVWRRQLAHARGVNVMAGELAGTIVAFCSAGQARGDVPARTGEVYAIYARAAAWGSGIGGALMGRALAWLREQDYERAVLWVLDTNARARRFYEKGGWTADGATLADDSRGFVLNEVRYAISLLPEPDPRPDTQRPAG